MKVYNLSCELDHAFEGWFASEADFSSQLQQDHIECPVCESHAITRMPSAPRLNLSGAQAARTDREGQLRARLKEMARALIANTEDVGDRFAEEARRIHYNEVPQKNIRGVASAGECEALLEEGIEVVQIPMPAALKPSLH